MTTIERVCRIRERKQGVLMMAVLQHAGAQERGPAQLSFDGD